eukprot:388372-Amphidinium_carterae.1
MRAPRCVSALCPSPEMSAKRSSLQVKRKTKCNASSCTGWEEITSPRQEFTVGLLQGPSYT